MNFKSSIRIKNSSLRTKTLFLEPWGEEFQMGSEQTFEFTAEADQERNFEIELWDNEINVFAWTSSTVKVFCEGEKIGSGAAEKLKVPDLPETQTVSSFTNFMFGKNK